MVWSFEAGAPSFYSGAWWPWWSGAVEHGDDVTGGERAGRHHRTVGNVEAVLGSVNAWKTMHRIVRARSSSWRTVVADVDPSVVYRAPASQ
jgi:hypothetical protein